MVEYPVMIGGEKGVRRDWINGQGREGWELVIGREVRITARVRPLQGRERFEMLGVNELVEVIVLPGRKAELSTIDKMFGEGFSGSLVRDASTRLVVAQFAGPGQADGHGNVANSWRTTIYRSVIGPP